LLSPSPGCFGSRYCSGSGPLIFSAAPVSRRSDQLGGACGSRHRDRGRRESACGGSSISGNLALSTAIRRAASAAPR
jgi:hypothetical protein